MQFSRSLDAFVAAAIAIAVSLIAAVAGYPMFVQYSFIVPSVFLGICALLRVKPMFLSGCCLALCTTNFFYIFSAVSTSDINGSGFVVMSMYISTGSGLIGAIIAAVLLRRFVSAGPTLPLLFGFAGVSIGFFSSQLMICNSVMWCGPLSFFLK